MTCKEFNDRLADLFDKEVKPQAREEMEQHMSRCPECRTAYEELRTAYGMLQLSEESQREIDEVSALIPSVVPSAKKKNKLWWAVAASVIFLLGVFVGMSNLFTASATAAPQSPVILFEKAISYVQQVGSFQMEVYARTRPQENFYALYPNEDFVKANLQLIREGNSVFYRVERAGERGRILMCNGSEQYMWIDTDTPVKAPLDYNLLGIYANILYPDRLLQRQKSAIEMNKVEAVSRSETDSTVLITVDGTEWDQNIQQLYETGNKGRHRVVIENEFSKNDGLLRSVKYWAYIDGKKILALYTGPIQYNTMLSKQAITAMPTMKKDKIKDINEAPEVKPNRLQQLQDETSEDAAKRIMAALSSGKIENIVEAFSDMEEYLPDYVKMFRGCKFSGFTKRTSEDYAGEYVYFHVQYPDGEKKLSHISLRNDNEQHIWVFDGGL
ncbi:MAG: zf-HC2 domain-containing protein [Bacteroidaceae bacterium]|nr:zf-HC2 domain-containing protein [Bacteroidaceae bacterium]